MTRPQRIVQGGRRRRRRRWPAVLLLLALLSAGGTLAYAVAGHHDGHTASASAPPATKPDVSVPIQSAPAAPLTGAGTDVAPVTVRYAGARNLVDPGFKVEPRGGLLFDVDTGRVLWQRNATKVLPIASLTKMMTALVVADEIPEGSKVKVTNEALHYTGSGVGVLPRGKWIGVNTMLNGLLLPSGNDAAIALAQRAAHSQRAFVKLMNAKAQALGLPCTRFNTPSGIKDYGNHSCAADLAAIARQLLSEPRLAKIVGRRQAILPFPIKGHRLYLYNNNPLLVQNYPGTTGVKTGYTTLAGHCLVASVRRGNVTLGVVLLHSPDTATQAEALFNKGFRVAGA